VSIEHISSAIDVEALKGATRERSSQAKIDAGWLSRLVLRIEGLRTDRGMSKRRRGRPRRRSMAVWPAFDSDACFSALLGDRSMDGG